MIRSVKQADIHDITAFTVKKDNLNGMQFWEETDVADMLGRIIGDRVVYDVSIRKFCFFTKGHWIVDELGVVMPNIYQNLIPSAIDLYAKGLQPESQIKFISKHRAKYCNERRMNAVLKLFSRQLGRAVNSASWNCNRTGFPTPDGEVDLTTSEIQTATPASRWNFTHKIKPNLDNPNPKRLMKFLTDILWNGNEVETNKRLQFLLNFWSYCLSGIVSEHRVLFIYGTGGNGKSMLANLMYKSLGDFAHSADPKVFCTPANQSVHSTHKAAMADKRLVITNEGDGGYWNTELIKEMSGGSVVTAHRMHKDTFQFLPQCKLMFMGNQKPGFARVDDGMRRRLVLLHLANQFTGDTRNRNIDEDIWKAEAPDILGELIFRCKDVLTMGGSLLQPAECDTVMTSTYFSREDNIQQFIDECLIKVACDKVYIRGPEIMDVWKNWNSENGTKPLGRNNLYKQLEDNHKFQYRDNTFYLPEGKNSFGGIGLSKNGLELLKDSRHSDRYKERIGSLYGDDYDLYNAAFENENEATKSTEDIPWEVEE